MKAIAVVAATAILCSMLVTVAAVSLRPVQRAYQDLERNRFVLSISGLSTHTQELPDREVVSLFQSLEARLIDLDTGMIDDRYNPHTFDAWKAASNPKLSVSVPPEQDVAKLGRRSKLVTVYSVRDNNELSRMIFPIYGQGMWSTIYGFIALESDLNTIAAVTFYEHGETPGIGDQILRPEWQASWQGRQLYDESGALRFRVGGSNVNQSSPAENYRADAMTGATVTGDAISKLVAYWFGPHGFAAYIKTYRAENSQ